MAYQAVFKRFELKYLLSRRWIKPVTEEGRAGLEAYRAELAAK